MLKDEALRSPVLRDQCETRLDSLSWIGDVNALAMHTNLAGLQLVDAEQTARQLGTTAAHQTG